jgi:hypothetical protein
MTILAKYQIGLLVAAVLLAGLGAVPGIVLLTRLGPERAPVVLILRAGHAPVRWKGWGLTSPPPDIGGDCVQNGFDRCSDGQDPNSDDVIEETDDNTPVSL